MSGVWDRSSRHHSTDSNDPSERDGASPLGAQTPLRTPGVDDEHVRHALTAALAALRERAQIYRWLSEEHDVYGAADPDWLREQATTDQASADVLDALLATEPARKST